MSLNLKPLFSLYFWFNPRPEPLLPTNQKIFLIIFGALILGSVLLRVLVKKNLFKKNFYFARIIGKIKNLLLVTGLLGFVFLFLSYERVTFLSSRFWYGLLFLGFVVWGVFVLRQLLKLPQEKAALEKKKRFEAYLPRRR